MNKKWTKPVHMLVICAVLLVYTYLLYQPLPHGNNETTITTTTTTTTTEQYQVKTIIAFSSQYKIAQQLNNSVTCRWNSTGKNHGDDDKTHQQGTWRTDSALGAVLLSAYHDNREDPHQYVRIIGLLPSNASFYCQLQYNKGRSISGRAKVDRIWSDQWGYSNNNKHANIRSNKMTSQHLFPSLISCLIPPEEGPPRTISLAKQPCGHPKATLTVTAGETVLTKRREFVVCVKPLNGTAPAVLRDWLRLVTALGAAHVMAYSPHQDQGLLRVLRPYVATKVVQIIELSHPEGIAHTSDIWHKRKIEIALYNDCFYRNLYTAQYIVPLDVDEVIVPKVGNNWLEMFSAHFGGLPDASWTRDRYASYSVRNVYFFSRYPLKAVMIPGPNEAQAHSNLNTSDSIFTRAIRSYYFSPGVDSVKSFIHVANTLSVFNHYSFHALTHARNQYLLPRHVAQLNHYRNNCDSTLIDGCPIFLNYITHDVTLNHFISRI